jgi:aminopeptidase N
MEDASGMDLDWFWRGWFYTTDNVDISLDNVTEFRLDSKNPEVEKAVAAQNAKAQLERDVTIQNNKRDLPTVAVERNPALLDFYNTYDPNNVTPADMQRYKQYLASLGPKEQEILSSGKHFYQLDFSNKGGLVMPLILRFVFEDGSSTDRRIPAEIWRYNDKEVSKVFVFEKAVSEVILDPNEETADVDTANNTFPRKNQLSRFELFKMEGGMRRGGGPSENPMQQARKEGGKN